jgi:hypothetical protein
MVLQRNRARGVKRNVTTNPAIFGETHFGLTAPTTISGISACSHPEETGRSGEGCSTTSCRGWAFAPGSFENGQTGELEETPGLSAGAWQMRPLPRGYVEAKSNRPGDARDRSRWKSSSSEASSARSSIRGMGGATAGARLGAGGILPPHVERGTPDVAVFECGIRRVLFHYARPRDVDQQRARLHQGNAAGVDA